MQVLQYLIVNCELPGKLPQLLQCQELQSQVLHVHNLELGRTHDAIAQAYAVQGGPEALQ